jgi:hypothetical protein
MAIGNEPTAANLYIHRHKLRHLELSKILAPCRPDVEARQKVVKVPAVWCRNEGCINAYESTNELYSESHEHEEVNNRVGNDRVVHVSIIGCKPGCSKSIERFADKRNNTITTTPDSVTSQ